jgi:hypothetical protein
MRRPPRLVALLSVAATIAAIAPLIVPAAARADETVVECDTYQPFNDAPVFVAGSNDTGTTTYNSCLPSGGLGIESRGARSGFGGWWFADVPSGWLSIVEAKAWLSTSSPCPYDGMSAQFAWNDYGQNGGTDAMCGRTYVDEKFSSPISSFGWRVWCANSSACDIPGSTPTIAYAKGVWLDVHEGASPTLQAVGGNANLWPHGNGWVRGADWNLGLQGGDLTGVCRFFVAIDGSWLPGTGQWGPVDQSGWHQCDTGDTGGSDQYGNHEQRWSDTLDTTTFADGWHTYQIGDENAAGIWGSDPSEQIGIDNSGVALSMSGPTSASASAGAQTVTATATAGASGVGGVYCEQNGGAWTSEPITGAGTQTATARLPIDQLGTTVLRCYATNRAVDVSGNPATSAAESWTLKIGESIDAGISFNNPIRKCRRVHKRVRVHKHRTRWEWVSVCHSPKHLKRVAHVAYGHRRKLYGWFDAAGGAALAHVPVRIIGAPNNGQARWRTLAVVTTDADGAWRATLPPGPGRLLEAVYGGGPTTLGGASPVARTIVAAKIDLAPIPRHVSWGGELVLRGRVLGGYVPGGQILRVLRGGDRRHLQVIANPLIRRDGRFVIRLAAVGGGGPVSLVVAVGTLSERDYPYAPGVSRRYSVTIG